MTIARLQYDGGGDWYANPSSLPNLLAAIRERTALKVERTEARVTLMDDQLWNYPFLHVTGHGNIKLTDAEVGRLREYLLRGGFLHVSDNYGIDSSFRREIARVFPDRPLVDVPLTHPVYHVVYDFPKGLPKIHEHDGKPARGFGIFVGDRLAVFYDYECDLGNGWEDVETYNDPPALHEAALRMGVNLFVYAVTSRDDTVTIREIVDRERSNLRRMHLAAGAAVAITATATLVAVGSVLLADARWLAMPRGVPIAIWLIIAAANVAAFVFTRAVVLRQTSVDQVSAAVEHEQSLRVGSLRGTMEVADTGSLGRRAAENLTSRLGHGRPLIPGTGARARNRMSQMALAAAASIVAMGALAPTFHDGLNAVASPVDAWRGTLLPPIAFENLPTAVVRGEALRLKITGKGRRELAIGRRATGEGWHSDRLPLDEKGDATLDVGPMSGDLYLVATDGRSSSDTVVIRVADRPFLGGIAMRAVYPGYLGRNAEGLAIGESVRLPAGTVVEVNGRASTALRHVALVNGRDTLTLNPIGHAFNGRFSPRTSGSWTWVADGVAGIVSDVPPPVDVELIPDSLPRAEILSPMRDTLVSAGAKITFRLMAVDDHGLSSVDIVSYATVNGKNADKSTTIVAERAGQLWGTSVVVDVAQLGLEPGSALHVRLAAVDNSPWAQRGESREVVVRIATAEEQRDMARTTGDSAVAAADAAVKAQKALERRTADAAQDRATSAAADGKGPNSMNFEAAQRAKAVAQDQKALADQVKQLAQTAKALEDQLKQAGALDSSLAKQLQEAQAMLADALTPEMLQQMQKLEKASQELSRDDAQQSLKDLKAQQQRMREQLEKSAEMLRRAAMEGSMQTLSDEAKDLAAKQRRLADSSAAKSDAEKRQAARELGDRSDRLANEMQKLEQRLENAKAATGAEKTQQAREHAQVAEEKLRAAAPPPKPGEAGKDSPAPKPGADAQPPKDAGQAKSGAQGQSGSQSQAGGEPKQGGDPKQGGQSADGSQGGASGSKMDQAARDAASQMDQAASAMKGARDGQVQEWKKELTSALDQSIQEMLQMSREENALQQQVKSGQAKTEDSRGQQSAIKQGLDEAAQRLQREAQKSSLLSGRSQRAVNEAQQKVDEATKAAADPKNASQSAQAMNEAAEALNKAASSLARDRQRANTASSASGFAEMIQQMQEMAGKQGSINSQAQSIMPQPGASMNSMGQDQSRALARQERQLADKLDELGDGVGGDKAAKMAQEARQLAELLDGSRIDAGTLARQQQLFKKMLDAGRSLEKEDREQSDKREAKAASGDARYAPQAAPAKAKDATRFREPTWDELRGLSADERRIILEYFKKLNGRGG